MPLVVTGMVFDRRMHMLCTMFCWLKVLEIDRRKSSYRVVMAAAFEKHLVDILSICIFKRGRLCQTGASLSVAFNSGSTAYMAHSVVAHTFDG